MKLHKILLLCLLAVAGIGSASAHGYYRGNVGVYFGPRWAPAYYPQPYFYSPPPVIVLPPPQPQVYIEQSLPSAPVEQQYWYYCSTSKSYYPYVKECSVGWQKVLPRPEQ